MPGYFRFIDNTKLLCFQHSTKSVPRRSFLSESNHVLQKKAETTRERVFRTTTKLLQESKKGAKEEKKEENEK